MGAITWLLNIAKKDKRMSPSEKEKVEALKAAAVQAVNLLNALKAENETLKVQLATALAAQPVEDSAYDQTVDDATLQLVSAVQNAQPAA